MAPEIIDFLLPLLFWFLVALIIVLAGYRWGAIAARQALTAHSPKWKAYTLALIAPTAIALAMALSGPDFQEAAFKTFWGTSTPAVIGVGFSYNRQRV